MRSLSRESARMGLYLVVERRRLAPLIDPDGWPCSLKANPVRYRPSFSTTHSRKRKLMQQGLLRFGLAGLLGLFSQLSLIAGVHAQNCGNVTTLAGLAGSIGSADSPFATAARFNLPIGISQPNLGGLYVADSSNHTIRQFIPHFSPSGVTYSVRTLAGLAGSAGNINGTGSAARFSTPTGVALSGNTVYVTDTGNNAIRMINTSRGSTTTLALSGGVSLVGPRGIAADTAGNVYVANTGDNTILKITAGVASVLAGSSGIIGSADGTGGSAYFSGPRGIAVDSSGNVYVADTGNATVRVITPTGDVSTLAGTPPGGPQRSPVHPASSSSYSKILVAFENAASALSSHPQQTILPPPRALVAPTGIAVDAAGYVYVTDTAKHAIFQVTPDSVLSTFAGVPGSIGSADGPATAARFNQPAGIVDDGGGGLYVADTGNSTIRNMVICPLITNFTPSSGIVGSLVTIAGKGFNGTPSQNTVTFFGGQPATVTAASYSSLTVMVPQYALTGPITVSTDAVVPGGPVGTGPITASTGAAVTSSTSSSVFTVIPPTITSFSTNGASVGTTVTLTGTLFDPTPANNTVTFSNYVSATGSAATATTLTVTVPSGAVTGPISVANIYGLGTSTANFLVLPTITGFSQPGATKGTSITITGTGFDTLAANDTVKFFNATVNVTANVTAATATTLTVTVPLGATTGPITVTTAGGTATSNPTNFLVIPVITSLGAPSGALGLRF
jgi:DNA-binding beta-propeller fold protein YncE